MTYQNLIEELKALHLEQNAELREKYDRDLPFAEALFDRWERAERLGFSKNVSVYDSALIFGKVTVGENTWIGPNTILDGSGGAVTIGAYCSISSGVHIYSHDTVLWSLSGGRVEKRTGAVSIADNCYIGAQSVIAANVTIGAKSVIAANSFVRKDIPERAIVSGSPARIVGQVVGDGEDMRLDIKQSSAENT